MIRYNLGQQTNHGAAAKPVGAYKDNAGHEPMAGRQLLMMITRYGTQKDYMLLAFEEMLDKCVRGTPGVDIIWAGDRAGDEIPIPKGLHMCADIVRFSREMTRMYAIKRGYQKMLWQGIDALYQSREDFERLISHDLPMVSALISARTDVTHACARRFKVYDGKFAPYQDDIPAEELMHGRLVPAGWPSVDNAVVRHDLFDIGVMRDCREWYEQSGGAPLGNSLDRNAACGHLDHSEQFCFEAVKIGVQPYIDTSVKVWHVHEDGAPDGGPLARLWPDTEVPLRDLSWG